MITHDVQTIPGFAYGRVRAGLPMPGVIEVRETLSAGELLEHLLILIAATRDDEWAGQVKFVPIR